MLDEPESCPISADSHQVGGDHYLRHAIQPWDIIEVYNLDFWEGNALKYLLRRKPGVDRLEDLRKAAHYLERCIEMTTLARAGAAKASPIP